MREFLDGLTEVGALILNVGSTIPWTVSGTVPSTVGGTIHSMGRGPEPNQRQQDRHQLSVLSSSSLWISSMVSCFKPLLPRRPSCGGLYPQGGSTIPSLTKLVSFSGVELMHLEKSLIELCWFLFCFCDLRKKQKTTKVTSLLNITL